MIELNLHSTDYHALLRAGAAIKEIGYIPQTEKPYKPVEKVQEYGWYFEKEI